MMLLCPDDADKVNEAEPPKFDLDTYIANYTGG